MTLITKPNYKYIWAVGGDVVEPTDLKKQQGWTAEVPPFQYENWIQNRQDQYLAHINQRGIPAWDALTEYEAGGLSYVQGSNGDIYQSVAASGPSTTTQDPVTDSSDTYWQVAFLSPGDVSASDITSGILPVVRGGTGVSSSTGTGSVALSNSPTFTGDPKAPTPPQFDNDQSLATTAFVQRALGNKAGYVSYSGSSVTLSAADAGKDIYLSFAGAVSVTLPNATTIPAGATFSIICSSATTANVTVTGGGTFAVPMGAGGLSYTVGAAIQAEFSGIDSNIYLVKNGAGAASLAASGYQRLPSGLIIQWGDTAFFAEDSTSYVTTFPIAFPTACYGVQLTDIASFSNAAVAKVSILGTTSFTASQYQVQNSANSHSYFYLAIGR